MASIRQRQNPQYRTLRDALDRAEVALRDQREQVAALRRKLESGTRVEGSYQFQEGPLDLSRNDPADLFVTEFGDLFTPGKSELIVQHMMYGADWEQGCPMCSMWADGLDGVAHHLADRVSLVVVARAPIRTLREWGQRRGWSRLRLLSSNESNFNSDFGVEEADGHQYPGLSVFTRDDSGEISHFYSTEASMVNSHHRAMDLYSPVWNLLDMLPSGRGGWMPKHFYDNAPD
jgi:predicted dithiol-disulfide oxidoreductase (DUF899 family)